MLLDLGRNDVGRVARTATVKVTDQFFIERFSQVMHIVSNVEGQLDGKYDALDALAAGFPAGTVSGAPKVRAMNHPSVPVRRRPTVAVLATGDELVMPGASPCFGEIVYSNGYATAALAHREGCRVADLGIVPDRLAETAAAVRRARDIGADILVTSGGASVGDYDLVQEALAAEGLALSFWKVALRPGRPMMHGRLVAMHVLGLPGNPVSSYVCAVLFLVPLLRRLAGRADVATAIDVARLGCDLPSNDERADYLRATLAPGPDGIPVATPAPVQDSSMLTKLARADCLLIREPHAPAAKAGEPCSIITLAS